jgi:hypothetical protein
MNEQKKFTIRYNFTNPVHFLNDEEKNFFKKVYEPRLKVKHRVLESKNFGKEVYDFLLTSKKTYDEKILKRLIKNFSYKSNSFSYKNTNL